MEYNVVEIFDSIEGEGKRSGMPATFIRLAGCNLRCSYCDTPYALSAADCEYAVMSLNDIMDKLNGTFKRITLTGGEPLLYKNVYLLVSRLLEEGFEINIETNGSIDIRSFLMRLPLPFDRSKLFFTIDYKLLSSASNDKMLAGNYTRLHPGDVIKFVVGSDEDVMCMIDFIKTIQPFYDVMPQLYIGTVYQSYDPKKLVEIMLKTPALTDARLQVQMHKLVWGEDVRGV